MKKTVTVTAVVLLAAIYALLFGNTYSYARENHTVRFGEMNTMVPGDYYVSLETTTIPYKLSKTGFKFGFTVQPKDFTAHYDGYYILYLPATSRVIGKEFARNNGAPAVLRTENRRFNGERWWQTLEFDPGDPLGVYRIEIYVNNRLLKSIVFNVVPDN